MTPEVPAQSLGKVSLLAGSALLLVPAIAIIVWSILARRRPRTNGNCALAVIFATIDLLIVGFGALINSVYGLSPAVRSATGLATIIVLIVAVIFAVNGLKEMNNRFGELIYDRGRKRAIAVLTLPFIFAVAIVSAVLVHSSGIPVFSSEIGGTAGQTINDLTWNFQLIAPPPWVTTEARKINPRACAALARQGPAMSCVVIPENVSQSATRPFGEAVEATKSALRTAGHKILAEAEHVEGGLVGRRIESTATTPSGSQFHVHWVARHGNFLYQITIAGGESARDQIRAESLKLIAGFRVIDAEKHVTAVERAAPTFASEKFGYSIDLANTVWNRQWPTMASEVPFADFGVLNARSSAAFCIIPVWIGNEDPGFEPIGAALAARLGIPFPDASLFGMRNVRQGATRGRAFAYEKVAGDLQLLYRVRILRGRGFAYLIAAWMNKKSEASSEFLDLALDCVSFPEIVPGEPLITGDRLRNTHTTVWNDIGTALARSGSPVPAGRWFERAYEVNRDNLTPLANHVDILIRAGKAADALAAIDRYSSGDDRPAMRRLQAQVILANGRSDEAIRTLLELRKSDPNNGDTALALLDAYFATQRFADAVAECDTLLAAAGEVVPILQRKGLALAQLKRFAESRKVLEQALAKDPKNADVQRLLEQVTQAASAKPAK